MIGVNKFCRSLWTTSKFLAPEAWHEANCKGRTHNTGVTCEPRCSLVLFGRCVCTDTHFSRKEKTVIFKLEKLGATEKIWSPRQPSARDFYTPESMSWEKGTFVDSKSTYEIRRWLIRHINWRPNLIPMRWTCLNIRGLFKTDFKSLQ